MSSDGQGACLLFDEENSEAKVWEWLFGQSYETVRESVLKYGIEMDQALMAITITPKSLGLPLKCHLKIGNDADIVLLESDTLEISGVISRGRIMMLAKELKCRDTLNNIFRTIWLY